MTVSASAQKPLMLDTVSVVASRTHRGDMGRSVEVISRDDIARSGARTVADVLRSRLSVDVDSRSPVQSDVSVRASSPEQVVVLVDGVRVSDAQSAHYAMDMPWRATNVGTATYRGFEAQVQLPTFRRVDYALYANGVTLDASQGAALIGKYALRPLTRQVGMRMAHRITGAADVGADLAEAKRAGEQGYLTGNARLQWQRNGARLAFDVHNLTNAGWRDASGKPSAARLFLASVGWAAP